MSHRIDWEKVSNFEWENAESICRHFFPGGKKVLDEWRLADESGGAGNSLGIQLTGNKAGLWHDRATSNGGRLRKLRVQGVPLSSAELGGSD
jgi:hypothetical protein